MPARDANNFLQITEAPGNVDNYFLFRVDGREMLSTPFEFRLTIRSQGDVPDTKAWIGASITFVMGASDPAFRKINGQCVRFEHAYQKGAYVEFVIDVAPQMLVTRMRRDSRIFLQKTAKEIVAQILREHSVPFDDTKVRSVTDRREYCVQHLESDFDFINRLMEEEGVFYYFKYEEGGGRFKHKMYMADDQAGFFDDKVVTKLSFRRDHLLRGLHSIETAESAATASWITHDYNYKKPKDLKPIPTASRLDWAAKGTHHYDWPGGYDNMTSGRRLSKMSMEEMEAAAILLEGTGSYLCFTPAARFEIDDPRLTAKERRIAIRSVIHSAWDPYSLDEGGEVSYTQQFTAIPSYQPYRPPCITPPAIIRGPQTAVVIDNVDPEGLGRVKVQFHWDRFASSTCWLRVAQQWAGKSYGAQFIPRIAMEVLVDFIDGDADRPIVTGCIYNGENDHPFKLPDKISQSGWRTTSYKQGGVLQEFIFEDKAGEEEIYTFAGRNYRRKVIKDEEVEIDEELREHIGHDAKIKVDKNAWVEVGETISISGRTDGKLVTNGPLTIESKVMLTLKVGSNTVELSPMGVAINGVIVRINS